MESAGKGYFEEVDGSLYEQGMEAIEHCWDQTTEYLRQQNSELLGHPAY